MQRNMSQRGTSRLLKRNQRARSIEFLEQRQMLNADWQNPSIPWDVDGNDGPDAVSPLDALVVINELGRRQVSAPISGLLPDLGPEEGSPPPFVDVNGDQHVTPLDALMVINQLGRVETGGGGRSVLGAFQDRVMAGSSAANFVVTSDTLVNTVVTRAQTSPDVAAAADGSAVVVWSSFDQDGHSWGIFGQRYNAIGEKIGTEFRVNTHTRSSQKDPAVAMAASGEFVVVWQSLGQDGSGWGVYGQRYDADGNAQGGEFLVNQTTHGHQWYSDVAFLSAGGFVITWDGRGTGDRDGIFSRVYSAAGVAQGNEALVNTTTSGGQTYPAVTSLGTGSLFAVAWHGKGAGDNLGVFMKRSDQAAETRVNPNRDGFQSQVAIAGNGMNDIVVSYFESNESGGGGVRAIRFDGDGSATDVIPVNQTTAGLQNGPAVTFLNDGGFAVAWYGKGHGDSFGIQQRRFTAGGVPATDEQLANTTTRGFQQRPAITNVAGDFVVVWHGFGEGDKQGIFARLFDVPDSGNSAPTVEDPIPDQQLNVGSALALNIAGNFSDRDPNDMLTFTATTPSGGSLPAWVQFNGSTGQFGGTPAAADVGTFSVVVRATDSAEASVTDTFQITVNAVNTPPQLVNPIPDQTAEVSAAFSVDVTEFFADTDAITYATSTLPTWLTFNQATQVFSGTPATGDVGTTNITVTVTDTGGLTASDTFALTVVAANASPILVTPIPNQTLDVAAALNLNVSSNFSDPDGDSLAFTATRSNGTALPGWLSFNQTTATFTGTPSASDVGTVSITVSARDPSNATVTDTFDIVVNSPVNDAPIANDRVFSILRSAATGSIVGTVQATDPDNDALTFAITAGNASGAFAINATTGEITVADSAALAAIVGDASLTITVSDDGNPTLSDTATITVFIGDTPIFVQYSIGFLDAQDNPITSIAAGAAFQLVVFVQDIRTSPTGVFSAFVDANYPSALVSTTGAIDHSSTYGGGTSGSLATLGLIDEAGGVDGLSALGGARFEMFRVPMQAGTTGGIADFTLDEADNVGAHPTALFGQDDALPASLIRFTGASLTITATALRAAAGTTTVDKGPDVPGHEQPAERDLSFVGVGLAEQREFAPKRPSVFLQSANTTPSRGHVGRPLLPQRIVSHAILDAIFAGDD